MKYVILGTGIISSTYVHAIADIDGSEMVACVSRAGKQLAADPAIPTWPDLESVPVDYDAVIIATPNGLHCEGAIAAAGPSMVVGQAVRRVWRFTPAKAVSP